MIHCRWLQLFLTPRVLQGSASGNESGPIQQVRRKISRMKKNLVGIHTMAAVVKKMGELATEVE
jgi:hypothetical protein